MDALTFFGMQLFCAAVLFWYVTNLNARSAGELGILGVVRDHFEGASRYVRAYMARPRRRSRLEERQTAFANRDRRRELPPERPGYLSDEMHAIQKVTLRNSHGDVVRVERKQSLKDRVVPEPKYRKRGSAIVAPRHSDFDKDRMKGSIAQQRRASAMRESDPEIGSASPSTQPSRGARYKRKTRSGRDTEPTRLTVNSGGH